MEKTTRRLPIVERDEWLQPVEAQMNLRHERYERKMADIGRSAGSLVDYANGYRYFGWQWDDVLDGWWLREWLPGAHDVYVFGDFNNWQRTEIRMHKDAAGVWSAFFPAAMYRDRLRHGSLYKIHVHGDNGWLDRIPAYARRVVQDDETKNYTAQFWNPAETLDWRGDAFDASKIGSLLIYEAHVGMAQEREGVGTYREFTEKILPIIKKDGYNAVQLMAVAEHPYYGSFGYHVSSFFAPSSRCGTPEELKELIRQHFNHPSICVWGLFNELLESGDNPVEYIKELNELAHQEDTTRPTTSASNQMGDLNFITDAIAWNRYDGWYGGTPADLGRWLDGMHRDHPEIRIAISEYGAGASIYHQQDSLVKSVPNSWWHPENWQTYYHIENWKAISSRPYIWGSFVWNMFDFGAAHRTEGDRPGINDKGLVTFDRKVRKDAFYFYKANWNKEEPVLYLAGKRNTVRSRCLQTITAFTNQPGAELFVNGKSYGKAMPDQYAILEWKNVELQPGENEIKVVSINKKVKLMDSFRCKL